MRRAAIVAVGALIAAVGSADAVLLVRNDGAARSRPAARAAATITTPSRATSTPTTAVAPTTTTEPLPVPVHAPADPYAAVPVRALGTIEIPRIGLRHTVYEGIELTVIDRGPGHWPGTAMPGQRGNVVFAGHRVTHTRPFRWLDRLRPGDRIVFRMRNGTFTYAVTDTLIVLPSDSWVVNQRDAFDVTLIACNPPGSARQRIVVRGRLIPNGAAS